VSLWHGALPDAATEPAAADDRRLWDDAGRPIRIPGDEARPVGDPANGHSRFTEGLDALAAPDHAAPEPERHPNYRPLLAAPFSRVETARGLLLARNRDGALVTPLVAKDPAAPSERPTYSRTSTGRVLAEIDATTVEAAWADNTRLREERDEALSDAGRELGVRLATQAQLTQAEISRAAEATRRIAAEARVEQLELTVRALGLLILHAAKHGQPDAGSEGGENDG
jgi:hypothetical protein